MDLTFDLLGWPADGPTLDLDHRRFAYAGKFVMSGTGKAAARVARGGDAEVGNDGGRDAGDGDAPEAGTLVAAVSFDPDRTDPDTLRLRYVTVREDCRGERVGPRLCAFVARRAREREFERVRIAVNNPFAYQALYRAGFGYTGERTGIAELVLERPDPTDRDATRYRTGFDAFAERDLPDGAAAFVADRGDGTPPERVDG